ncbi:subtilisin family serine protease [Sphingomonas naasensis]|uniref:Peptidase S8 n=1 Tax=Sphingomonas naasensis TaxID=1344951 RepID=A0A4S1W638_9SPHN|nr:S8 family serine peptidase [Sphingomonas naasensis]NIJ21096.1 subtilisin family serine protease [Sphingomonas naasensis]TGX38314.1 peptidase S8 [Sphingomonas naasensis]
MSPHFVVTLAPGRAARCDPPHWQRAIADKGGAAHALTPAIGALLERFALPVWTTHEYRPGGSSWSADERASGLDRVYRLILQHNRAIPEGLIESIRLLPEVADARPGAIAAARLPDSRPAAAALGLARDDAARRAIGLPTARRLSRGEGVTVAVIDTGVDLDHCNLRGSLLHGYDFVDILDGQSDFIGDLIGADDVPDDEVGHGTHVTGIIAATGEGAPEGVAPAVRVLPVRVLATMQRGGENVGAGLVENINNGVKWAVDQGVDVINMSLGVRHEGGGLPHREVIDYAARKGVTIVAAAGNDGQEAFYYPGAFPSVIAVGAAGPDGNPSSFSTFGPQISLIAPGEEILSTAIGGGVAHASGTSHAAPFAAGAAALIHSLARSRGARIGAPLVKRILTDSADRIDARFKDRHAGFGRLNIADALRLADARLN